MKMENKEPTMLEKYKSGIFDDKDNIIIAGYNGIPLKVRRGQFKGKERIELVAEFYSNDGMANVLMVSLIVDTIDQALTCLKNALQEKLEEERFN